MDLALRVRSSVLSGTQLPGWITLSLVSHVLVLAAGLGTASPGVPYRPASLTVDIAYAALDQQQAMSPTQPAAMRESPPVSPPARTSFKQAPHETPGPATTKGPIPIDNYFDVNELDVRAEPINDVLLRYPWMEYKRRLGGVVRFTLFINAQGGLDKVDLIEANPPGHFEEAALDAVTKLQFSPARRNGRPVKSRKTIDVVFDPNDDVAMPSGSQALR